MALSLVFAFFHFHSRPLIDALIFGISVLSIGSGFLWGILAGSKLKK
jgi:hypothetical protein